jgi:hypothetical protein
MPLRSNERAMRIILQVAAKEHNTINLLLVHPRKSHIRGEWYNFGMESLNAPKEPHGSFGMSESFPNELQPVNAYLEYEISKLEIELKEAVDHSRKAGARVEMTSQYAKELGIDAGSPEEILEQVRIGNIEEIGTTAGTIREFRNIQNKLKNKEYKLVLEFLSDQLMMATTTVDIEEMNPANKPQILEAILSRDKCRVAQQALEEYIAKRTDAK